MPPTFAGIPVAEPSQPAAAPRFSGIPLKPRFDNTPKPIIFDAAHGRPQTDTQPQGMIQPPNPMAQQPAAIAPPAPAPVPVVPTPQPAPSPATARPLAPLGTGQQENTRPAGLIEPINPMSQNPGVKMPSDVSTTKPVDLKQVASDSVTAIGQSLANVPQQWASIIPNLENMGAEQLNELVNARKPANEGEAQNQQMLGRLAAMVSLKAQLESLQNEEKIKPIDAAPGSLPYYIGQIVGGAAEQAPGIVASIATRNPWPMLAFIGADQAGSSYKVARDSGLDPKTALSYAAITAGSQMALGAVPLHEILASGAPILRKILGSTVSMGVVSAVQTGLQTLVDKGFLGKDTSLGDAIKQMTDAGIIGAGTGFLFGLGSKALDVGREAVSGFAKAATDTSKAVLGNGVAPVDPAAKAQADAAFAQTLTGLPIEDRVTAIAKRNAELAAATQTSTPPEASSTPADTLKRLLDGMKTNDAAAPPLPKTDLPGGAKSEATAGNPLPDQQVAESRNSAISPEAADPVERAFPGIGAKAPFELSKGRPMTPRDAVSWYTGVGYAQINKWAREGTFPEKVPFADRAMSEATIHALFDAASPLPQDTKVFRGRSNADPETGFRSYSTNRAVAEQHAKKTADGRVDEVTLPKGMRVVTVKDGAEREIIALPKTPKESGAAREVAAMLEARRAPQVRAAGGSAEKVGGRAVTQTPEFKRWFGDSKTVDGADKPVIVYHSTEKPFRKVDMKKGAQGVFWVTSDKAKLERGEAGASGRGAIMELYAKIERPAGWKEYDQLGIDELIHRGYDGVILPTGDDGHFDAIVFDPNQIKSVDNKGAFSADKNGIFDLKFNPGPKHIPTIQSRRMPGRHSSVLTSTGQMEIPEKPTFRDEPRKKLLDVIGNRLYQGKVRGQSRLGFYRQANSEIRVKHYDDIEVQAHEAAHFLEFHNAFAKRFMALRKKFSGELDPLSYTQDPKAIGPEGFAEYVRLWATQYAAAKGAAPQFTKAFEAELKRAALFDKMVAFQKAAHRWYYQGELSQLRGKVGESDNFVDTIKAVSRARIHERMVQGLVDPAFAAKVIERETTGDIASAEKSPYKLYRMTVAAESMAEAAVQDGALKLERDGSYSTDGQGLAKIFYPATKHGAERLDLAMTYFRARRAEELLAQGRERLFTKGEVAAGLALAKAHPEFKSMFEEWKGFNDRMLTFYTNMDLITPDMADAFRERNQNYVPSHRIINTLDPERGGNHGKINKRLTGGEQAVRETYIDILDSLHANVAAALSARAKSSLFRLLERSQEGSEFAAPLAPDSKKVEVAKDQQLQRMISMLNELGYDVQTGIDKKGNPIIKGPGTSGSAPIDASSIESILAVHPEFMAFWQHNQEPTTRETSVEPVIIDGEVRYFEVNSPLLAEMLTAPRETPGIIRFARAPKRFFTKSITGTLQFLPPNLVKDTVGAAVRSKSGFRAGYDSLRGFKSFVSADPRFKAFRANGGLFAGRVTSQRPENKNAALLNLPARNGFELMGKALAKWEIASAAGEQGTRLGEFDRGIKKGLNPLEAAYRGRVISTDFAQVGRNDAWRWLMQITPFANAGLQGIESDLSHMVEVKGRVSLGKGAMRMTQRTLLGFGGALTAMTVALWLANNNDERYQGLTVDEKARFWWFFPPDGGNPITIPKPYGVGFVVGDLPEMLLDYVKARTGGDPHAESDLSKQLAYSLMQHFYFMDWPGIARPLIEGWENKTFTGAPIVPGSMDKLQGSDVVYQRTDKTPELYRQMGKMLGVSPLIAEHYAQGFAGYLEQYLADASEAVLWNAKAWGPRPFARTPLDYVTHQFVQPKVPLRTKWTEGYYDLQDQAASKAQAYTLLFKEHARDSADFTTFTQSEVNLTLKTLSSLFTKTNAALSQGSAAMENVKYDPTLTQQQKEDKINAWYAERNSILEQNYKRIDALVSKLESGIK